MRKLYFSTDTELKSFCERTLAQLLSPATIYFRIGHSALFRNIDLTLIWGQFYYQFL